MQDIVYRGVTVAKEMCKKNQTGGRKDQTHVSRAFAFLLRLIEEFCQISVTKFYQREET